MILFGTVTAIVSWSSLISVTISPNPKTLRQPRTSMGREQKHRVLISSWAPDPVPERVPWTFRVPDRYKSGRLYPRKPRTWPTAVFIEATFLCQRSSTTDQDLYKGSSDIGNFATFQGILGIVLALIRDTFTLQEERTISLLICFPSSPPESLSKDSFFLVLLHSFRTLSGTVILSCM